MKELLSRVSLPGRVIDLIWSDDEYYRDIISNKKVTSSGKFPRCDQWCDEEGFHMAFALAGYSSEDVEVFASLSEIHIHGQGLKTTSEASSKVAAEEAEDDYPAKEPNLGVQTGMIVRGIARRNFKTKYFINQFFDTSKATAVMNNGLLEIIVPKSKKQSLEKIKIQEK
tara:strand:+ start:989 stop:1495 length:507 start_codon:yes stop_codon:yes gene_type:complete